MTTPFNSPMPRNDPFRGLVPPLVEYSNQQISIPRLVELSHRPRDFQHSHHLIPRFPLEPSIQESHSGELLQSAKRKITNSPWTSLSIYPIQHKAMHLHGASRLSFPTHQPDTDAHSTHNRLKLTLNHPSSPCIPRLTQTLDSLIIQPLVQLFSPVPLPPR